MKNGNNAPVGEILVSNNIVSEDDIEKALQLQSEEGGRLCYNLIRLGCVTTERLTRFFQDYFGFVPFRLEDIVSDVSVIKLIPAELAIFYKIVPTRVEGNTLYLAVAEGQDNSNVVVPAIEELTGMNVEPAVCPHSVIVEALDNYYGSPKDRGLVLRSIGDNILVISDDELDIQPLSCDVISEDDSELDWLRTIIAHSIKIKSREVHINPGDKGAEVLFSFEDSIEKVFDLSLSIHANMVSLVKRLAKVDARGSFRKHEGYMRLKINRKKLTAEIALHPSTEGDSIVLKIYDRILSKKGFNKFQEIYPDICERIEKFISAQNGVVIISSPFRGDGKAVLYSILEKALESKSKIISLEKEITVNISNVMQSEFKGESEFGSLVESALSQNPGLVAVSGIEEKKSLEKIFIASSKVPFLVFIAAQDSLSIVNRMKEWGLKSAVKAGVIDGLLAVQGVEPICEGCKVIFHPAREEQNYLERYDHILSGFQTFTNNGCSACNDSGILEKFPLLSFLEINESVLDFMESRIDISQFEKLVTDSGYVDLISSALLLAVKGKADMRDIMRMVKPDEESFL